jgi:uncharacterized membrane protein YgcG
MKTMASKPEINQFGGTGGPPRVLVLTREPLFQAISLLKKTLLLRLHKASKATGGNSANRCKNVNQRGSDDCKVANGFKVDVSFAELNDAIEKVAAHRKAMLGLAKEAAKILAGFGATQTAAAAAGQPHRRRGGGAAAAMAAAANKAINTTMTTTATMATNSTDNMTTTVPPPPLRWDGSNFMEVPYAELLCAQQRRGVGFLPEAVSSFVGLGSTCPSVVSENSSTVKSSPSNPASALVHLPEIVKQAGGGGGSGGGGLSGPSSGFAGKRYGGSGSSGGGGSRGGKPWSKDLVRPHEAWPCSVSTTAEAALAQFHGGGGQGGGGGGGGGTRKPQHSASVSASASSSSLGEGENIPRSTSTADRVDGEGAKPSEEVARNATVNSITLGESSSQLLAVPTLSPTTLPLSTRHKRIQHSGVANEPARFVAERKAVFGATPENTDA